MSTQAITDDILHSALQSKFLTKDEGIHLYQYAGTAELMAAGHQMRLHHKNDNIVTWIIDRNVNTTNVCIANCKFCNFFRKPGHEQSYITTIDQYVEKIEEMERYGGDQLLIQGGHHPDLGLQFYVDTFKSIKKKFPHIKLHALGPPEIAHITKLEKSTHTEVLLALQEAGLDTLPGAGAEILSDRVRRIISKGKCTGGEWLDIMRAAHQLNITSSATMMFGHVETIEERMDHWIQLRQVQSEKPKNANGFLAFIPWPFQDKNTLLHKIRGIKNYVTGDEYVRMIALSRLMLPNIINIQASWLTVGKKVAQMCLYAGANDFGSIMIEENVVSVAGAPHRFTSIGIQDAIREAGFIPQLRTQKYEYRTLPDSIEQQVIIY